MYWSSEPCSTHQVTLRLGQIHREFHCLHPANHHDATASYVVSFSRCQGRSFFVCRQLKQHTMGDIRDDRSGAKSGVSVQHPAIKSTLLKENVDWLFTLVQTVTP